MAYIPALSIRQPWAWLIVRRHKRIENRPRRFNYRGPILLHASLSLESETYRDLLDGYHPVTGHRISFDPPKIRPETGQAFDRGGIVGIADLVDCVEDSDDPFFVGPFGLVLDNARPLRFQPCKGMLGLFNPKIDVDLSEVP